MFNAYGVHWSRGLTNPELNRQPAAKAPAETSPGPKRGSIAPCFQWMQAGESSVKTMDFFLFSVFFSPKGRLSSPSWTVAWGPTE